MKSRHIGVISDTHGLLRPEAMEALEGSELIIHAGDVGDPAILDRLREIAPVHAVRGNVDTGEEWRPIPMTAVVAWEGKYLYVLHRPEDLNLKPEAAGFDAVITGHTHRPRIERQKNVLYFNPGSAGPRRFSLPVTVGKILVEEDVLTGRIVKIIQE